VQVEMVELVFHLQLQEALFIMLVAEALLVVLLLEMVDKAAVVVEDMELQ
jgi:hypothetical protein